MTKRGGKDKLSQSYFILKNGKNKSRAKYSVEAILKERKPATDSCDTITVTLNLSSQFLIVKWLPLRNRIFQTQVHACRLMVGTDPKATATQGGPILTWNVNNVTNLVEREIITLAGVVMTNFIFWASLLSPADVIRRITARKHYCYTVSQCGTVPTIYF